MKKKLAQHMHQAFPQKLSDAKAAARQHVHSAVTALLTDIATHVPLSSDSVEAKNGECQSVVSHRGSMRAKGKDAARESTLLQAAARDHEIRRCFVDAQTMPSRRITAGILRQCNVPSGQVSWILYGSVKVYSPLQLSSVDQVHTANCRVACWSDKVLQAVGCTLARRSSTDACLQFVAFSHAFSCLGHWASQA